MEDRIEKILNLVLEKSRDRSAVWTQTSRDSEYKLQLSAGYLSIDQFENNFAIHYDLAIYNLNGDKIFYKSFQEGDNDEKHVFNMLAEIHTLAINIYYRADETFDNFLEELEKEGKVGEKEILAPAKKIIISTDDLPF